MSTCADPTISLQEFILEEKKNQRQAKLFTSKNIYPSVLHMEVPRLGVELELQLPAWDP